MLLFFYAAIFVITILAGATLARRLLGHHRRTQLVMSFVSGLMLGVAVFHLLPHALYLDRSVAAVDRIAFWMMAGLLSMFLLQRLLHFHQHENPAEGAATGHGHQHHGHEPLQMPVGQFGGAGVLFGLSVHALLDGVALAASIQAETRGAGGLWPLAGLGVFLAILLHKPLDALTIVLFAERRGQGMLRKRAMLVAYALLCPLTAAVLLNLLPDALLARPGVVSAALAFSAGIFLCIALGDLLPEIHFHDHDRLRMTAMLLAGIALAWSLRHLEVFHGGEEHRDHAGQVRGDAASGYHSAREIPAPVHTGIENIQQVGNLAANF